MGVVNTSLPALDPLEMHSGVVSGSRHAPPEPEEEPLRASNVMDALEELLLPALMRQPCLVAFSGGRDSSVLLAVAAHVARRHGLDDPIPLTRRYPEHPRTNEDEWQELVVQHLGLTNWQILNFRSEVEALGPVAREALRRHGLHWPGNAHGMNVFLRAAVGGSVITGNGGDETFLYLVGTTAKRASFFQILRMNPLRKVIAYMPLELLPKSLRALIYAKRILRLPWLRPDARRQVIRRHIQASKERRKDVLWNFRKLRDSRYLELARGAFAAYAEAAGTLLCEPFFDFRFHQVAVATTPPGGYASRNDALATLFGNLLPARSLHRMDKAVFTEAFWGPESRAFAERWDGAGLDYDLVDPDALRAQWARPRPDLRSITPLQAAWLHADRVAAAEAS